MTAITAVSGYPKKFNMGSKTLVVYKGTDVDDGETLDTGLSADVSEYWVTWTGNPSTQASAGGHSSLAQSTGIITLYPSSDNLGASIFVMTDRV